MNLIINNIGKIQHADIRLDGITVICGENNSGKSTIGKVLFCYFNSLCDFESKIKTRKIQEIRSRVLQYSTFDDIVFFDRESVEQLVSNTHESDSIENIFVFLQSFPGIKDNEGLANDIASILNKPNNVMLNEYVYRFFMDIFNEQVINANNTTNYAIIKTVFSKGTNLISFHSKSCNLTQKIPIMHHAYYIDNPFVINYLNVPYKRFMSELDRNIIDTIKSAELELSVDKMVDIFDSVANKDKLNDIRQLLKRVYSGTTINKNGLYFYHEGENDIDFRNISTGLKAFALIERLLECGKLKSKDVLILDEPEIHLHPDWQIVYAELIVLLQKTFDLTILVVTHSFHFLESLKFYIEKYKIQERGNFYVPQKSESGYSIKDPDNSLYTLMDSLSRASFHLADLKFEFNVEQNNGTTSEEYTK